MSASTTPVPGTVPTKRHLDLYDTVGLAPKKVAKFLQFSKEDLAEVTGLSKSLIKYDNRIPDELKSYFVSLAEACEKVAEVFSGDILKTEMWFFTSNPHMGNISPRDMIRRGRLLKLLALI